MMQRFIDVACFLEPISIHETSLGHSLATRKIDEMDGTRLLGNLVLCKFFSLDELNRYDRMRPGTILVHQGRSK